MILILKKGGDLVSLQTTLGHANISTTGRYAKALMEGKQRLVSSFEMPGSESNIIEFNHIFACHRIFYNRQLIEEDKGVGSFNR